MKAGGAMIRYIWAALIVIGVAVGIATGKAQAVSDAALTGAKDAALLCISLIGAYALWLGTLRIAQDAGLVEGIARRMRGVIRRLFPGVPKDSPANGYITLNLVANIARHGQRRHALWTESDEGAADAQARIRSAPRMPCACCSSSTPRRCSFYP